MKITRRQALPVFTAAGLTAAGGLNALPGLNALLGSKSAQAEDLSTLMDTGPLGEHMKGDPNAPVTIIKYASMTCPHCRNWHIEVYPTITEKYINTGQGEVLFP